MSRASCTVRQGTIKIKVPPSAQLGTSSTRVSPIAPCGADGRGCRGIDGVKKVRIGEDVSEHRRNPAPFQVIVTRRPKYAYPSPPASRPKVIQAQHPTGSSRMVLPTRHCSPFWRSLNMPMASFLRPSAHRSGIPTHLLAFIMCALDGALWAIVIAQRTDFTIGLQK